MYYYDRTKYEQVCGGIAGPIDGMEYLDSSLESIFKQSRLPTFSDTHPISFSTGCWCAYQGKYNNKLDQQVTILDQLDISHRRVLGIDLFNFPLLSFDAVTSRLFRWLITENSGIKYIRDLFYYTVLLRVAWEIKKDESEPVDIWNLAVTQLQGKQRLEELLEIAPYVVEPSDLVDSVELDEFLMLRTTRVIGRRWFLPLIPAELYSDPKFYIKNWGFLSQ